MSDLFAQAASHPAALLVLDERRRLAGVIPDVTLLAAMGNGQQGSGQPDDLASASVSGHAMEVQ